MSDTPRTDAHSFAMESEDLDVELAKTYELAWQLERELAACKGQLFRICQEGFGNDDTIGLEPADDYVLRKLAEWQDGLKVNCSEALAQVFNAIRRRLAASQAGQAEWQALAEGLAVAISAIHQPVGDETPTSGNPCIGPKPQQGRAIAAALAAYEAAKASGPAKEAKP